MSIYDEMRKAVTLAFESSALFRSYVNPGPMPDYMRLYTTRTYRDLTKRKAYSLARGPSRKMLKWHWRDIPDQMLIDVKKDLDALEFFTNDQ